MTIRNVFEHYVKSLSSIYEKSEAESISYLVMEDRLGLSKVEVFLKGEDSISEVKANDLAWKLMRLLKNEPVQYVLGHAFFCGMKLKVNKHVLIPRPETEELVEWIVSEQNQRGSIKILDVGTGSGCIALALKKAMPDAEVVASDISTEALDIAKRNADACDVNVQCIQQNILSQQTDFFLKEFDVIVSNPPYVLEKEKLLLHKNVLNYEPALALFVPDNEPLKYYSAILNFAKANLRKGGAIYFEINPDFQQEINVLFKNENFKSIEIREDLSGKKRMARATNLTSSFQ